MNIYGIGYGLAVLPLAAVFGNMLLVHRVVTFIFIVLCGLVACRAASSSPGQRLVGGACGLMVMLVLAALGGNGAFPASMGSFVFLIAIALPFHRSFDRRSLWIGAMLALIAFYTKPYFVLAFAIVATYLFAFVSKKRALTYTAVFVALFVAIFVLVRVVYPLYFFDVVLSNFYITSTDQAYAFQQLGELALEFLPLLILALLVSLTGILASQRRPSTPADRSDRSTDWAMERPLLSKQADYFGYAGLCSTAAFVFILGPHQGAHLTYAYQLVLPPFLIWLFRQVRPQNRLAWVVVPLVVINLVSLAYLRFKPALLEQSQQSQTSWAKLDAFLDGSTRVLNSPLIVPALMRRGMWPIDSGLSESFFWTGNYPAGGLLAPALNVVNDDRLRYLDSIRQGVMQQEFDRIIVTSRVDFFFDRDLVSQYYTRSTTLPVDMPQSEERWLIVVWEPNPR
jgi:hypothetical protein